MLLCSAIFAQLAGSSVLGCLSVTTSKTLTGSPRFKCPTTSLLIWAWPRMFTLFCLATAASPGTSGSAGGNSAAVFVFFFLDVFAGVLVVVPWSGGNGTTDVDGGGVAGVELSGGAWSGGGLPGAVLPPGGGVCASKAVEIIVAKINPSFCFIFTGRVEI